MVPLAVVLCSLTCFGHVTIQTDRPLQPHGLARVNIVVPNESDTDTTEVSLSVPDAFLAAGGRLSRVDFPAGWQVKIEKEDQAGGATGGSEGAGDREVAREGSRRARIKKVTFSGGTIPPDGFKVFNVELQLPDQPGQFRFPAVQAYAGGKVISWSELVQGAAHPAPTLVIEKANAGVGSSGNGVTMGLAAAALGLALVSIFRGSRARTATAG